MPLDKHNSRTAWATDLISSLINVASSQDVPFHQPQELQCLHHGATYLCIPLYPVLSSESHIGDDFGRRIMISVQDINIAEALLTLFLAYNVIKRVCIAEIEAVWSSCIKIWGTHFSIMAGWIAEMLFVLFFIYCFVMDRA